MVASNQGRFTGIDAFGAITIPDSGTDRKLLARLISGFTAEQTGETNSAEGYISGAGGDRVTFSTLRVSTTQTVTILIPGNGWQDMQLIMGNISAAESGLDEYNFKNNVAIATNIITDAGLAGLAPQDVSVSLENYEPTTDTEGQLFTVVASPGSATTTTVVLDNSANTLTFDSSYNNREASYAYRTSTAMETIGGPNSINIRNVRFEGTLRSDNNIYKAGTIVQVPSLTLDGNVSWGFDGEVQVAEVAGTANVVGSNKLGILLRRPS